VSASSPRFAALRTASRKQVAISTDQIAASNAATQKPVPLISWRGFMRQLPAATTAISGWRSPCSQNAGGATTSHVSPRRSAAVIAASTRQASIGRVALCVGRLEAAAIAMTVAGS
jgi:hypothetical protein